MYAVTDETHDDPGNPREASVMNAMYEKKLALQAESYIQLKIAYEELTQVPPLPDFVLRNNQ